MQKKNVKFAKEDIIAIEELAEQLASELNDDDLDVTLDETEDSVPIVEGDEDDIVNAAEELLGGDAELPDEKAIADVDASDDDATAQSILDEADALDAELQKKDQAQQTQQQTASILAEAEELEKQLDACTAGDTCPDCGKEKCECAKVASESAPGIEDEIGDEANGGDPSVSEIVDNNIDTATDKEVFGQNTDSEYVAKITARLDRVATALEKRGMKKMAFRVDQLSDKLEASIR